MAKLLQKDAWHILFLYHIISQLTFIIQMLQSLHIYELHISILIHDISLSSCTFS